jgi:signal transduction histidine kinase
MLFNLRLNLAKKGKFLLRLGKMQLRTKFLLALLSTSAGLTMGTLLTVRFTVERQVRSSIRQELQNSVKTFRIFQQQKSIGLAQSADFIANLPTVRALVATQDGPTIQDASTGLLRQSGAALLLFADRTGRLSGLESPVAALDRQQAQKFLDGTLSGGFDGDLWVVDGHLFQVHVQPVELGQGPSRSAMGILVLGDEINREDSKSFSELAGCDVAFLWGDAVLSSTLPEAIKSFVTPRLMLPAIATEANPQEVSLAGERFLAASLQISSIQGTPLYLTVFKSFDKATAFLSQLNRLLVALGLVTLISASLLAFFLAKNFTRSLGSLVSGVKALERGDYEYPLEAFSRDEVGVVTDAFAKMRSGLQEGKQEQVKLEARLRQAHKMEAVGRLAGGVAHDFNNLLTIIRGHSDLLIDKPGIDESERRSLDQIKKAANRAVAMTRQLLAFSRKQVLQPKILDLNSVLTELSKMLSRLIGEQIDYRFEPQQDLLRVLADPGQIEQVVMNLAVNARDAMPSGGTLWIRTASAHLCPADLSARPAMSAGSYVLISVSDTGHGMDEETKSHIFEPFFTTKEVGKGTGLGLATVYGIVKQSGGFIWVDSTPGKGTTFEIYLPAVEGEIAPCDEIVRNTFALSGSETVLIAEDEEGVRDLAARILRSSGYKVLEAKDGMDALQVAQVYEGPIHVLLTDIVMPRLGGPDLAERLKSVRPDLRVVMMSGYSDYLSKESERLDSTGPVLQKPFTLTSLLSRIRETLRPSALEEVAALRE